MQTLVITINQKYEQQTFDIAQLLKAELKSHKVKIQFGHPVPFQPKDDWYLYFQLPKNKNEAATVKAMTGYLLQPFSKIARLSIQ